MSEMSKWFIREKKGKISKKDFFIIPTIKVWYNKRTFLRTGRHTEAWGIKVHIFVVELSLSFQKW